MMGKVSRLGGWLLSRDWWAPDLWIAVVLGVVVAILPWAIPPLRLENGVQTGPLYLALFGANIAILGVVFTVIAIFTAFLSRSYRRLLSALPGGLERPLHTYRIVARSSVAGALLSIAAYISDVHSFWEMRAGTVGLVVVFTSWSVMGAAMLLGVTADHVMDGTKWEDYVDSQVRKAQEHTDEPELPGSESTVD